MKERVDKTDVTEIILEDEEVRRIIQSLIKIASEKGYYHTNVEKAISRMWKEMVPVVEQQYVLTDDEVDFSAKADKFIEEFGTDLIEIHDKVCKMGYWKCGGYEALTRAMLKRYKDIIIGAYCNFCRNDSITQKDIQFYAVKILGEKNNFNCGNDEVRAINELFTRMWYPVNPDERPFVNKEELSKPRERCLYYCKSYQEFLNKYKFQNRELVKAAMTAIWFIQTYY